ncbi:MAG: DNA-methyltransferase [Cetobacterium sp.]|uniref:DNA-methyltransferase n=2 Tax=Cetobacterium sp. TaxID=2071632 RepID=UPI003EE67653
MLQYENYKIFNNDCFEVLDLLAKQKIKLDLVILDLPYGKTKNKWDIKIPLNSYIEIQKGKKLKQYNYQEFMLEAISYNKDIFATKEVWNLHKKEGLWDKLERVIKSNCPVIMFGQSDFTVELINSNRADYRYSLIWDKMLPSNFLNANKMPMPSHEDIVIFYKKLPTYNPQKFKGKRNNSNTTRHKALKNNNYGNFETVDNASLYQNSKFPRSILRFKKLHSSKMMHPTQKPVELISYLIKTYSNENELIGDFVSGSFTTGAAALLCKRKFIGCEKELEYFNAGKERMEQYHKEEVRKTKNRSSGMKYKTVEIKKNKKIKNLENLVYNNFNLSNKQLAEKIGVSENEFYRSKYNLIANELRDKCKQQSLF